MRCQQTSKDYSVVRERFYRWRSHSRVRAEEFTRVMPFDRRRLRVCGGTLPHSFLNSAFTFPLSTRKYYSAALATFSFYCIVQRVNFLTCESRPILAAQEQLKSWLPVKKTIAYYAVAGYRHALKLYSVQHLWNAIHTTGGTNGHCGVRALRSVYITYRNFRTFTIISDALRVGVTRYCTRFCDL